MGIQVIPAKVSELERILSLGEVIPASGLKREKIEAGLIAVTGKERWYLGRCLEQDEAYVHLRRSESLPGWIQIVHFGGRAETPFDSMETIFWRAQDLFKEEFYNARGSKPIGIFLKAEQSSASQKEYYRRLGFTTVRKEGRKEVWFKRY